MEDSGIDQIQYCWRRWWCVVKSEISTWCWKPMDTIGSPDSVVLWSLYSSSRDQHTAVICLVFVVA